LKKILLLSTSLAIVRTKQVLKMGCLCSNGTKKINDDVEELLITVKKVDKEAIRTVEKALSMAGGAVEEALVDIAHKLHLSKKHSLSETCIPGVYAVNSLHNDLEKIMNQHLLNEVGILVSTGDLGKDFKDLVGKPRSDENYTKLWNAVNKTIGNSKSECEFLPHTLDAEQIRRLVANCPFITMGMSYEDDGICFNCENSTNPITAKIMAALTADHANTKLWLSNDLKEIKIFTDGKTFDINEDFDAFQVQLRKVITCILYFFEMAHAVLHVYAYIMLEAASFATFDSDLGEFMGQYREKVLIKYEEVALLLLKKKTGLVVGGYWKADQDKALDAAKDVFAHYAKQNNAREFFDNVFCGGFEELIHNRKLSPQSRQYISMMGDLAQNVVSHVPVRDRLHINNQLRSYLRYTGGKDETGFFSMTSFREWIECQGMLGILHGNTLSISRLVLSTYNRPNGDWESKTFDESWPSAVNVVGTMLGLEEDHAILQSAPVKGTQFHSIYEDYQQESNKVQKAFWDNIEDDDKIMYGWIQSVWGPNMLDSTQLTVTTYV